MGCAFSDCCRNPQYRGSQDPSKIDERSPLLAEHSAATARPLSDDSGGLASSLSKTDEQSILNRILHKAAKDIIDVSEIEPHSMERSEYMERMRHYLDKTASMNLQLPKAKLLPSCTHAPMNVLLQEPVSQDDINFVIESSKLIAASLSNMRVTCKEPLIVSIDAEPTTVST